LTVALTPDPVKQRRLIPRIADNTTLYAFVHFAFYAPRSVIDKMELFSCRVLFSFDPGRGASPLSATAFTRRRNRHRRGRIMPAQRGVSVPSRQRVSPAQSLEASEIRVSRAELGSVFDCERGEMRVGGEIACGTGLHEQIAKDAPVTFARFEWRDRSLREPCVDGTQGVISRQRMLEHPGARCHANESEHYGPGESDTLFA